MLKNSVSLQHCVPNCALSPGQRQHTMQADIFLSNSANALLCEKLIKANSSRRCRSGHRDGVALGLALPLTLLTNLIRDCKVVSISETGEWEWDRSCWCFRIKAVYMISKQPH